MKSLSLIAIPLLFILFSSGHAHSQSVDSTQVNLDKKMVKAITNEKGEVVFVFHDGREAQVFYGPSAGITGKIKLQQVENSCGYELPPPSCVVEGYFQNMKFQMQWTKHSDPRKLSQVVEIVRSSESSPAERVEANQFLSDITYQKMFSDKPQDFPKYKLKCDQSQWIQNVNQSERSAVFSSISSEIMLENFETQVNENQTIAEIYNAQFDLISNSTYELSSYQYSNSMISSFDPFFSNQVVHFVYQNNNKSCHVAFAANIGDLANKIQEMQESSNEIQNKKVLRNVGNFSGTELSFSVQEMLRVEKDDKNLRYQ
jgi:hypothetical protein